MLDLKFIRENALLVKRGIENKGESAEIDKILSLDKERRDLLQKVEKMKHERNILSGEVSKLKKEKKDASEVIEKTREFKPQCKRT